jgi:hypothetical protein
MPLRRSPEARSIVPSNPWSSRSDSSRLPELSPVFHPASASPRAFQACSSSCVARASARVQVTPTERLSHSKPFRLAVRSLPGSSACAAASSRLPLS